MKMNFLTFQITAILLSILFYSCQKLINEPAEPDTFQPGSQFQNRGVMPYKFERINKHNFFSQGWKEQQVNIASGVTTFSELSDHIEVVCGPDNNSDPRLIRGCITMNLPTSADPTLRRIRLRRGGYTGTLLADLTALKYSTYVVNNAPTIMVLQIDVNGDEEKDFNIFFSPTPRWQNSSFPPVVLNTWQQWDALQGIWHFEAVTISGLPDAATIAELVALHPTARIIDTPPLGHNGEGVRFTIGGNPRSDYDNTIGYFDALIIGTKNEQHSTLYDFTCNQAENQ